MRSLPSTVFLLTRRWGGVRFSTLSRLPAFKEYAAGTILNRKAKKDLSSASRLFSDKILFFNFLRPFSYARKKKDQKEARPSAGGRFFRESPQRHECNSVACDSLTCAKTSARNGSTRKNPPYPRSLERKNLLLRETWPCSLSWQERAGERGRLKAGRGET